MILRVFSRRSLAAGTISLALAAGCFGQQTTGSASSKPEVVLIKLGPIAYPQIARTAHVAGDVYVAFYVRRDGTVPADVTVTGPELLMRAAVAGAIHSQFECRMCGDRVVPAHLLFTFKLVDNPDHGNCSGEPAPTGYPTGQTFPVVTVSGEHVTIVDLAPPCVADVVLGKKVRSRKCLYLWRCGHTFR